MCFTIDILLWSFPVVQTASEGVNARIRKPGPWTETENLDHNGPFHLGPKQGKPARGEVNVTKSMAGNVNALQQSSKILRICLEFQSMPVLTASARDKTAV
jgi:hypothetical protein